MDFSPDDEVGKAGGFDNGIGRGFGTGVDPEACFDTVQANGHGDMLFSFDLFDLFLTHGWYYT